MMLLAFGDDDRSTDAIVFIRASAHLNIGDEKKVGVLGGSGENFFDDAGFENRGQLFFQATLIEDEPLVVEA